ncbi:MAG: outer rane receptor for ferrienterochelin and colicin [Deltaproteobacteria bacterium]|nr:outer rane receptor for ferrienterochelin and colicin [Deltaproteobacteria bacterium]
MNRFVPIDTRWQRRVLLAALVVLGIALQPVTAAAADGVTRTTDLTQVPLEELLEIKVENVYSASRFEQSVTEAPASVSIITADDIRKSGYRTLADILNSVRGFYVSNDRNYSYLGVRGFSRPGDYNTRVLLMIDGHRLNDNIYDQAQIGTEFPLDVDLIERVEIVRGPGSSLYGTSAFFAVINVVTRPGWHKPTGETAVAFGSDDAHQARLTLGGDLPAGATALVSGTFFDTRGERSIFFKEYDDPATNHGTAHNVDDDRSYSLYSRFSWRDFTLQALFAKREKTVPTGAYGTVFNDSGNRTYDERGYLDLKYQRKFDPTLEILGRLTYDSYNYDGRYVYDYSPGGPSRVVNKDKVSGRWWGGELQLTKTLLASHILTMGGEWRDNLRQDQRNFDEQPPATYLDDNRRSYALGLFLQDSWKILASLNLTLGVRYDYNQTAGSATSPRAALVYSPWEKTAFKLLFGAAFRAPNANELYYDDNGISTRANRDLKPEKIRTYEGVYEQYLGEQVRTSLTGFYYRTEDLISQVTDPGSGLATFQNIDKTEAYGGGAEIEGRWANELAGRLSYSYQVTRDLENSERLTNSPRQLLKGNLTLPLVSKYLFSTVEVLCTSGRRTLAQREAGGFVTTNLTLFSKNLLPGLEFSCSVYNLFDRSYGDPGGTEHLQDSINQEGRTFRAKLSYRF